MSPGTWGFFATTLTSLGLGWFVYQRNPQSPMNRTWLQLSLATAVWALATGLMVHSPGILWAFGWARTAQVAISLIPAFFFRFSMTLVPGAGHSEGWIRWNRRAAGLFAVLALTPLMIRDLRADLSFQYYPVAGPLYGLFALWFLGIFFKALFILVQGFRTQIGYKRNQLRYVILASVLGLLSFFSMILMAFGLPIPPLGQGLLLFYAIISYAIVRWRLMDISIVIKNTLIYASLYSVLVGLFVVVVVFFGQLFFYGPQALDRRVLWMCIVALSIVTALVRPLDTALRRLTDRLLFQQKYEWQKTLKQASKGMTKVTSSDRLLKLMAHFIGMRVRVTHVGILHRSSQHFTLKVTRGRDRCALGLTVDRNNPLVAWLEEKKEVLTVDEVHSWLRSEKLFPRRTVIRRTLQEILSEMEALHAQVCVPSVSKMTLQGILVLGEKLSGDPYSQEDLDILSTLASEGAIAMENAQLYEQLFQRMSEIETLYQREHNLFIHTAIALAAAVDARDPYTHGHTERVTAYASAIVKELLDHPDVKGIPRFEEQLNIAALLHDIGKIGIPDEILRKKGKLTPKEFKKMQEHSVIGAIILQPIKGMEEVAKAVKAHHERYDGKGYPEKLRGTEIPIMTRVISVADTFDSMTTDRPYRKHLSNEMSLREIEVCAGTQFDPVVVAAFLKAYRKGQIDKRPVEAKEMLA